MDLGLKGKSVIVVGGASNIGRSVTLTLAREGAHVVIADLDVTLGSRVASEAEEHGGHVRVFETDVTDRASIEAMLTNVDKVHVLINTVGWWHEPAFFLDTPPEIWDKLIDINYLGVANCLYTVLPMMVRQGHGSVVSIASDAARVGEFKSAVYSGAKAGIVGLTKALAREVGPQGIRLNVVCPGATIPDSQEAVSRFSPWSKSGASRESMPEERRERMKRAYPLRRLGTPDDIARAVVFLASDAASFITGQTLSVSGGFSMV